MPKLRIKFLGYFQIITCLTSLPEPMLINVGLDANSISNFQISLMNFYKCG